MPAGVMRVGVYIDRFNLYYGGKAYAKASQDLSWKWLDIRAMCSLVAARRWEGRDFQIAQITYCTARIAGSDEAARRRQDAYIEALRKSGSVDSVVEGTFVERYTEFPRARKGAKGRPLVQRDSSGRPRMVGVSRREEKGSDVSIATHLLWDALNGAIHAAMIVPNDSDLSLPVRRLRDRGVPIGTVNPRPGRVSVVTGLTPQPDHRDCWFDQLTARDFARCPLPDPCRGIQRPVGW